MPRRQENVKEFFFYVPLASAFSLDLWNASVNCQKPIHKIGVFSLRLLFAIDFTLQVFPSSSRCYALLRHG